MPLPAEFLETLKARNDIESVVSAYVNLRRSGRNMAGLCPFHNEKSPSFMIYPENDSFYCFGCGAGGDVITFIRRIENLDYMEAVRFLAQRAGMEVPAQNQGDEGLAKGKLRLLEANREAARYYHKLLDSPPGAKALEYLRGRRLSDKTIRHFGLGYSPEGWTGLCDFMRGKGFSERELVQANLATPRKSGGIFDRFRNRVMFPIIDLRGNVIGFGGRVMEKAEPKYLNTAETLVFNKGSGLFAMNFAKNAGSEQVILAEGYMDVISLHQAGFTTAVASLGTALTPEQARLIARYAKETVICYDADGAGQRATARAIPILKNAGLQVRVLSIPEGKDPDEFIKTKGPERFKMLLESSGNDVDYRLQKLRGQYRVSTPDGRVNYLNAAAELLAGLQNPIEQDIYAGRLAAEFQVEKATLLHQIAMLRKKREKTQQKDEIRQVQRQLTGEKDHINPQRGKNMRAALAEESIISYLVRNPDRADAVAQKLPADKFSTAFNRGVYEKTVRWITEGRQVGIDSYSQDYSIDEMGRIAQILVKGNDQKNTIEAENDYISVILQESEKPTEEQIAAGSDADFVKYLEQLKKRKM